MLRSRMPHSNALLHCYCFLRNGDRYYIGGPNTLEEGITMAELELKQRERPYVRATVEDVRANTTIWQSNTTVRSH